jgi:hypothetical protein
VTGSILTERFPAEYRNSDTTVGYNPAGATSDFLRSKASWLIVTQPRVDVHPGHHLIILVVSSPLSAIGALIGERLRVTDEAAVRAG